MSDIEETFEVNAVKVTVQRPECSAPFSYSELEEIVKHCNVEPNAYLRHVLVKVGADGYLDLEKHYEPYPFERIRRITGYLVGTVERFNDAKKAEEHDRVKHGMEGTN